MMRTPSRRTEVVGALGTCTPGMKPTVGAMDGGRRPARFRMPCSNAQFTIPLSQSSNCAAYIHNRRRVWPESTPVAAAAIRETRTASMHVRYV